MTIKIFWGNYPLNAFICVCVCVFMFILNDACVLCQSTCLLFSHHLMWSKAIGICARFLTEFQYSSHAAQKSLLAKRSGRVSPVTRLTGLKLVLLPPILFPRESLSDPMPNAICLSAMFFFGV